jgi:hypothetical protein
VQQLLTITTIPNTTASSGKMNHHNGLLLPQIRYAGCFASTMYHIIDPPFATETKAVL